MRQPELFAREPDLPAGFQYRTEFVSPAEEQALLDEITKLPLHEAQYKEWTAKRRIASFGGRYDFSNNQLLPAEPIPSFLHPLRVRIAEWIGLPAERFTHSLIAEYQPRTQLGWHRDVPNFEAVAGISLKGHARMRFRPYPPRAERARATLHLDLEPRSAYLMTGPARWDWQHAISPTKGERYSITFRTLAEGQGNGPFASA
jgi:alkylated DNA repair dioxygenase AlkB